MYARPRSSRTAWNSREEDSPPKIASRTRAAKRRSSPRCSPRPPSVTWTCSVSLRTKRTFAPGEPGAGSGAATGSSARRSPSVRVASSTICVVVDRPGRRDHDRARHVAPGVELRDHVDRRVADHRRAADDRPPERVRAEDGLAEHVEDRVLRVVLVHGDLLEHDLALGVDVLERRPPHHVGHHVEGRRQVLVEHPRVDRGALLVGAGVELGAHAVEELVDLGRRVAVGAAEQQVLEEVREAGLPHRLTARAGGHEEAQGRGPHGGHGLRDDPQPGVELRDAMTGNGA